MRLGSGARPGADDGWVGGWGLEVVEEGFCRLSSGDGLVGVGSMTLSHPIEVMAAVTSQEWLTVAVSRPVC